VTAIELLPIHHSLAERSLIENGLTNYWGYNPIAFFAPDTRYAVPGGDPVTEFKTMGKAFHRAGIEVLLDVVYNHTAEGDHLGPNLCLRGIDNANYYRLLVDDRRRYQDFTGCGNSVSLLHPRPLQLVLDSLRYWVNEMHVDGFRFDLLPTLARDSQMFDGFSRFLAAVQQDPVLARVKLIAEPWDLGPGGYRLGEFPAGWAEWNGRYRDDVRRFWRGDQGYTGEFARRLSGSADLFEQSSRGPDGSINYVTCHDGFTLQDVVSYATKHNLSNKLEQKDGMDENYSSNWGIEGPSTALEIVGLREQTKKNLFATLVFSLGVPMISHGDELSHTLAGNNNSFCHDNDLNWLRWDLDEREREFLEFARNVLHISRDWRALRERPFPVQCRDGDDSKGSTLTWIDAQGHCLPMEDLDDAAIQVFGMLVQSGRADAHTSDPCPPYLLLVNAGSQRTMFKLPELPAAASWHVLVETVRARSRCAPDLFQIELEPRSLVLLAACR